MDVLSVFSRFPRPLRSRKLLVALFLYRLVLCLSVLTAESPDEWWQSEEVAYYMVFGRGQLTWEWQQGIRSYVFPFFYAAPLFLLKWSGLDTAMTVWASTRCVQALLFFLHDCAVLALAQRLDSLVHKARKSNAGIPDGKAAYAAPTTTPASSTVRTPTIASAALAMLVVEWFLNYDGVRCYSNVVESLFFLLALHHQTYQGFLFWAGVACAVRVTAVFALVPVFALHTYQICRRKGLTRGVAYILLVTVGMVIGFGGVTCLVDYIFYGRLVVTPVRFLKFNIVMDVSRYYGVHPGYWYAAVLPLLAAPFSVFLLWMPSAWSRLPPEEGAGGDAASRASALSSSGSVGVGGMSSSMSVSRSRPRSVQRELRRWMIVMLVALLCHSAVAHKEMRFVYLLLPLVLLFSCVVVVIGCTTVASPSVRRVHRYGLRVPRASVVRRLFNLFWCVNAILLLFVLYGYRRGGPTVMREVRNGQRHFRHLEVLTHCYATPGYSHVHGKVDVLGYVDCPMVLNPQTLEREVTQDRLFNEQPGPYALWRFLRVRSPLSYAATTGQEGEGRLSEAVWWREMERLMPPVETSPELPDGLVLFHNTARVVEEDLLRPKGYRLDKIVAHAPHSFEPNEDRVIELWVRDEN